MNFFELLKWSWNDAKDSTHSCLNDYSYEKGYKEWNLFIPKSDYFEKQCFEKLAKVYGCGLKKILVDLLIPNLTGHTTQLDIVFINKAGIYSVECKNYNCNILIGGNSDKWVRREHDGAINRINNPVIQNSRHIDCLKRILYFPSEYYHNIVTVANTSPISYDDNTDLAYNTRVINYNELNSTIREISKSSKEVFTDKEIYEIYEFLSLYARYSKEDRMKHLEYVQMLESKKRSS